MDSLYSFVSGPLLWLAFLIFACGSVFRLSNMFILINKKERFIYSYINLKYSLRSLFYWSVPFLATNWRMNPVFTIVTFAFHISLILSPLFLMSHVMLFSEAFGLQWVTLPDCIADIMTLTVITGSIYFFIRRIVCREVRFVTSVSDFIIIVIVAAPFVTGFLAYHQFFNYQLIMTLHALSGVVLIVTIPFTRLSHMLLAPFTRAYTGSEFGAIRHAKDW